ncbi:MAG: hypothetical protein AAED33_01160, partial [Paracoccaceae bacterium]
AKKALPRSILAAENSGRCRVEMKNPAYFTPILCSYVWLPGDVFVALSLVNKAYFAVTRSYEIGFEKS